MIKDQYLFNKKPLKHPPAENLNEKRENYLNTVTEYGYQIDQTL